MTLFKKAVRAIWQNRRAYIACILLIAVGIATYVSFNAIHVDLIEARASYYADQRFADLFAKVRGAPIDGLTRLGEIEGVAGYTARLTYEARLVDESGDRTASVLINSYDPGDEAPINDFLLLEGERSRDGILLGEEFAAAHGLQVGDSITLNFMGRATELVITGIATGPEFIYHIRSINEMLPDPASYGFAFMEYGTLAGLTGQTGWANDIGFVLAEGYTYDRVRYPIEDALEPYGFLSLGEREDQMSHSMLDTEIGSMGSMAGALPVMFIGISVIMLYIMLRRIIEQERTQIGILMAYGHATGQILVHYLCYGAVVGFLGGLIGDLLGYLLTQVLVVVFLEYFKLPALGAHFNSFYLLSGLGIATLSGVLGALSGTLGVLRLNPSEAMRPAAPPPVRFDMVGRIKAVGLLFTTTGRMALRSIDRGRFRALFVALGVTFAFAITAFMASYGAMFDALLFELFDKVEVYDMKLTLETPAAYRETLEAAWAVPDIKRAEGIFEIPAEISIEHRSTGAVLTGLPADSVLYRVYDSEGGRYLTLEPGGVYLSNAYAEKLNAKVGDRLLIRSGYFPEEAVLPVVAIFTQNMGSGCYLHIESLWGLTASPPALSALILSTGSPDAVKAQFMDAPLVAGINEQGEIIAQYETFLAMYEPMITGFQIFGILIAFAIINTTSSIALSERKRELATLRVLGMQPGEVSSILTFEYWLLTGVGMVLGIPVTGWFKGAVNLMIDVEMFTIPTYTPPLSFVSAAVCCGIAVLLANRSMRKQVEAFDLIEVLKERE